MASQHEQALSVKELRTQFPSVVERLSHGQDFIVIHRSKPIARLSPYASRRAPADALKFFAKPPKRLRFRSKKSAVQLVRDER